ncbi:MAG: hypothetical protein E6H57_18265 [Betaproteobacteria bacterium]|nr:MAG: hypothetical protein E6H57_18265 [Betaproteobacteria bacterium]
MSWVGRSLRRFEDRALLLGRGRFTADTANGAAAVRFARSPVARGRIRSIAKPDGALVFTAADLADVKPIRPLLHRPDYVPMMRRAPRISPKRSRRKSTPKTQWWTSMRRSRPRRRRCTTPARAT